MGNKTKIIIKAMPEKVIEKIPFLKYFLPSFIKIQHIRI